MTDENVITNTEEIARRLAEADVGDEFTVEVEDTEQWNREVYLWEDTPRGIRLTFGDPGNIRRAILVKGYDNLFKETCSVKMQKITDDPDNPFRTIGDVTCLWDWRNDDE